MYTVAELTNLQITFQTIVMSVLAIKYPFFPIYIYLFICVYLFIYLSVRVVIWCDYVFMSDYLAVKMLTSPQYHRLSERIRIHCSFLNAATSFHSWSTPGFLDWYLRPEWTEYASCSNIHIKTFVVHVKVSLLDSSRGAASPK